METEEDTRLAIEAAIKTLAESKGEELIRQIRPILYTNLDRGRVTYFTNGNTALIPAYLSLVLENYTVLHEYIHRLQIERNTEAWEPLFQRMQTWAYNFFLRKNFSTDHTTEEAAIECATEAAITLLHAHFPYDTEFDPWAHMIVQNTCRKFMTRALKKSVVPPENKVDLNENQVDPDEVLLESQALRRESIAGLESMLSQLSEARRRVIEYIYFQDMAPEEVARILNKSVGAIYSLQFQALRDLRKILHKTRDNINE